MNTVFLFLLLLPSLEEYTKTMLSTVPNLPAWFIKIYIFWTKKLVGQWASSRSDMDTKSKGQG